MRHQLMGSFIQVEFDWNSKEQGVVLGAFFYGFITTQILGGIVAPIIGAARLLGLAIFASGVLTLMTPTVAYYGVVPLVIVRVLLGICQVGLLLRTRYPLRVPSSVPAGDVAARWLRCAPPPCLTWGLSSPPGPVSLSLSLSLSLSSLSPDHAHTAHRWRSCPHIDRSFMACRAACCSVILCRCVAVDQGVVYPAMQELWSHWAPPMESTRLLSITYSGSSVGTFTAMAVSGVVARHLGWHWIFYIFGICH